MRHHSLRTNAPSSIYSLQTHGCIRLHPDDIKKLFESVDEGVRGEIIYEPLLTARVGNSAFIEVHPDIYGRNRTPCGLYVNGPRAMGFSMH